MGNINRTDDASQQQEILTIGYLNTGAGGSALIATGSTLYCSTVVPRQMAIQQVQATCFGISGAPQLLLGCLRFSASTSYVIGTTMAVPAYGTSGYMAYSLVDALGATKLLLQKGDILVAQQLGGASAASTSTIMNIVVKNLQDIKSWY